MGWENGRLLKDAGGEIYATHTSQPANHILQTKPNSMGRAGSGPNGLRCSRKNGPHPLSFKIRFFHS